jgi:hypothetical protein
MSQVSRFSVVIPAFNASRFVRDALRSVACARGGEDLDYVFVMDDGSTDDTAQIAEDALSEYCLPGVVLRSDRNLGSGETRRRACELVESPVVMCVDADDLVCRNRFVDALHKLSEPGVILVGGDVLPSAGEVATDGVRRTAYPEAGPDIAAASLFFSPVWSGTISFRRAALEAVQMPIESAGSDWLFTHRVIQAFGPGAVANTGSVLINHRQTSAQARQGYGIENVLLLPVWSEILSGAIGLNPSPAELSLHTRYSTRHLASAAHPLDAEHAQWLDWAHKLLIHAVAADYVPAAVSRRIAKINAELSEAASPHTKVPA